MGELGGDGNGNGEVWEGWGMRKRRRGLGLYYLLVGVVGIKGVILAYSALCEVPSCHAVR